MTKNTVGKEAKIFQDRLRQALAAQGISQAELARRMRAIPQTIYKYFSGERLPGYQALDAIARALKTSPAYFFGSPYPGLTRGRPEELEQAVQKAGGWDAVYEMLTRAKPE
jgi:transcriptional regulator with XRE-family HTH domain